MVGYISKKGLINLANWKYVGGQYTYFDDAIDPFFTWCAKFIPTWIAPNFVTVSALLFTGSTAIMNIYFDPSFEKDLSPYFYVWGAFSVFMFQILDACDGKHARRTGLSSPLGQLLDHGVDSVNCFFTFFIWFSAGRVTACHFTLVPMMIIGTSTFYLGQWEEFHSHKIKHALGKWFGVQEAQAAVYIIVFTNGVINFPYTWRIKDIFPASTPLLEWNYPGCVHGIEKVGDAPFIEVLNTIASVICGMGIPTFIYLVWYYSETKPRCKAILGLVPLLQYWGMIYCIINYTGDWAA